MRRPAGGARTVVFAVGNESRGDDGLGPWLARRIEARAFPTVSVVLDFQLQLEHALDLADAELTLFVDAAHGLDRPFAFEEIGPSSAPPPFSHALPPQAVLGVFERVESRPPPPAFVLAVRGASFGLGEGLSPGARDHAEAAWAFLEALLAAPQPARWHLAAAQMGQAVSTAQAARAASQGASAAAGIGRAHR